MLKRISALFLLFAPMLVQGSQSWEISASEWARPRHGDWLARQPALTAAIEQLQQKPEAQLQILYPGGDEGVLWADELQAWLVALGVGSNRIEQVPGSGSADRVQIRLSQ